MNNIFYANVEQETIANNNYRHVVFTGNNQQFVYMSIKPLDDIHMEVHKDHDQFIRIEKGEGIAILNSIEYKLYDGIGIIIPAGAQHQIINTSKINSLKLYTIYSPPEHKQGLVQESNPDKVNYKEKYLKYKSKYLKSLKL